MKFDNTFIKLPSQFYSLSSATPFASPKLIKFNEKLAGELGLNLSAQVNDQSSDQLAKYFVGEQLFKGSEPLSQVYAAHQFGHFVDQLGDGRAMLLGEILDPKGQRFDIQLKGAGQTKYSRRGDGKSAIGPVIREYLLSEAMHSLGVPTTRALAAVATGEMVYREEPIPGAVFTRVASSHLRIGSFQYFAARGDLVSLKTLLDYCIDRHYPEIKNQENPPLVFLQKVAQGQIKLVAHWMSLGFIHGVMNTDNMTISGQTIDYGPCAFMDYFNFNQVYSFIDKHGRYAYSNQPQILIWNLSRLAECLIPLFPTDEHTAIEILNHELSLMPKLFEQTHHQMMAAKLGLNYQTGDEEIIKSWFAYLQTEKLDFTLSFRKLSDILKENDSDFFKVTEQFKKFEMLWRPRLSDLKTLKTKMDSLNPLFIPRNHLVEKAITGSIAGDYTLFEELNTVWANPFKEQPHFAQYTLPPKPVEIVKNTFCGT
jgi:uncharacterized protein YdiU (UPF0061 family)